MRKKQIVARLYRPLPRMQRVEKREKHKHKKTKGREVAKVQQQHQQPMSSNEAIVTPITDRSSPSPLPDARRIFEAAHKRLNEAGFYARLQDSNNDGDDDIVSIEGPIKMGTFDNPIELDSEEEVDELDSSTDIDLNSDNVQAAGMKLSQSTLNAETSAQVEVRQIDSISMPSPSPPRPRPRPRPRPTIASQARKNCFPISGAVDGFQDHDQSTNSLETAVDRINDPALNEGTLITPSLSLPKEGEPDLVEGTVEVVMEVRDPTPTNEDVEMQDEDNVTPDTNCDGLFCFLDQEQAPPQYWRLSTLIGDIEKRSIFKKQHYTFLFRLAMDDYQPDVYRAEDFWSSKIFVERKPRLIKAIQGLSEDPIQIVHQAVEAEKIVIVEENKLIDGGRQRFQSYGIAFLDEAEEAYLHKPDELSKDSLEWLIDRKRKGLWPPQPHSSDSISISSSDSLSPLMLSPLDSTISSIFDHGEGTQKSESIKTTPSLSPEREPFYVLHLKDYQHPPI